MVRHRMLYAGWINGHILTIFSAADEVNRRAVEVSGEEESWIRHGRQQYGRPHIAVFGLHTVRHLCINHCFISVRIKLWFICSLFFRKDVVYIDRDTYRLVIRTGSILCSFFYKWNFLERLKLVCTLSSVHSRSLNLSYIPPSLSSSQERKKDWVFMVLLLFCAPFKVNRIVIFCVSVLKPSGKARGSMKKLR